MIATVIHKAFEKEEKIVAMIAVDAEVVTDALEYVYEKTQNLYDAWTENEDIAVFNLKDSHRSTSVGDIIVLDGTSFEVEAMGFSIIM